MCAIRAALLISLALGGCVGRPPPPDTVLVGQECPTYLCRRVIDGDTIEVVDAGGIRTRVRLRRVNAPELSEPGGPEAKAALEERLLGKQVRVRPCARDRYGRLVADVAP